MCSQAGIDYTRSESDHASHAGAKADLPKNTLAAIQQHQMKMGETLGAVVSKDPVARQLRVVMALADVRHAVAYGSTMLPFVARAG